MTLLGFFVPDFEFFFGILASGFFLSRLIVVLNHRACPIAASRFLGSGGADQQRNKDEKNPTKIHRAAR
jgi:hypothetical protein